MYKTTKLARAMLMRRIFGKLQYMRGVPRWLYLTRHLIFPRGQILVDTPDGLPITIDPNDYGQLMLFYFPYTPEQRALLADLLQSGDICLDLGANVGLLTVEMARLVTNEGIVLAVDPNPVVVQALQYTIQQHFIQQIRVLQAGVAAQVGVGSLSQNQGRYSESMEVDVHRSDLPVPLTTIDEIVGTYLFGRAPTFIKVDIEGSEVYLLDTMKGLLASGARPTLLVEFHREKCVQRGGDVDEIRKQFRELGYKEYHVKTDNHSYTLSELITTPSGRETILFISPHALEEKPLKRVRN